LGKAKTGLDLDRLGFLWDAGAGSATLGAAIAGGSITAIHQIPPRLRSTTPPAEISRTILFAT
jgi:hypothetical protein